MPTSPHRRVQRDATAKRRRSRVQRASEAPDGSDHDLPGYDARRVCAKGETARKSLFLKCSRTSGMPLGLTTLNFKS